MYALIVITPFQGYPVGAEITDPATISAIEAGPYSDFVVRIPYSGGAGGGESIAFGVTGAYVGTPLGLAGTCSAATTLDWSIDGGTNWTTVANYVQAGVTWVGTGPTFASVQSGSIIVRDHNDTSVQSAAVSFTVLMSARSGTGTLILADGSAVSGIGTGLSAGTVTGPGNLAVAFGDVTGTVADGGVLATVQAAAAAALPSTGGTMTGALAFSAGNGLISCDTTLVLAPGNQLWLGGTGGEGAVYSVTIAGATSNPGNEAVGKIWNNGGVLSLAGATLPQPAFTPGFSAAQPWQDIAGSVGIFGHHGGVVPAPPASQAGLLFGDREKLKGIYSFGEIWPAQDTSDDAWPALQHYLLYAQLMYLAQKSATLDNVAERDFVDVVLPAGDYIVSQPLVVPENIRLGGPGRVLRAPYTGVQAEAVAGVFASNQYLPTVVVAPRGHLSDLNIYCTTDGVFAHRGSGVCLGKNWQANIGADVTVGNPGSDYSVGDLFVAVNPSVAPYSGWVAQVTAVNGTGGITAASVTLGGAYALPPAAYNGAEGLQATQWTAANGFTVFDPANAGCFVMKQAYRADFVTPSPGTSATLAPVWEADFVAGGNSYVGGAALTCGTQAGRIQITGSVPALYDTSGLYGPTFNVMLNGLEFEIDSIQGLGGQAGLWARFAQDCRIGRMNFVESAIGFWCSGAGSIECANVVLDTCGAVGVIDQSHGIRMHGRAFWEEGNLTITSPLINTQGYALKIGAASTPAYPCSCLDIKFTVINMGGLPASTIAAHPGTSLAVYSPTQQPAIAFLAYLYSSTIDLTVSNLSQYGGAPSPLPSSGIYQLGQAVDTGNDLRGSIDTVPVIDGVAAPAQVVTATTGHGFPGCAIRVWDGLHQCWVGPFNTVEMFGTVAPVNGVTGAGLASPGSTFVDMASGSGRRYVNTGTQTSPIWA
jgi:hypothetical protein